MENLLKAAVLLLLTLVVIERVTRGSKREERSKKADVPEPEVPPLSVHGYIFSEPSTPQHQGCDSPAEHGSHGVDSGCGDFSSGHQH